MNVYTISWKMVMLVLIVFYLLCVFCSKLITYGYLASARYPKYVQLPAQLPQSGFLLGLDTFWHSLKAFHQHRLLSWSAKHFEDMKVETLRLHILGVGLIVTIEPKNLQTILALKSGSWGLGKRRKMSFRPLLGDGMATSRSQDTSDLTCKQGSSLPMDLNRHTHGECCDLTLPEANSPIFPRSSGGSCAG